MRLFSLLSIFLASLASAVKGALPEGYESATSQPWHLMSLQTYNETDYVPGDNFLGSIDFIFNDTNNGVTATCCNLQIDSGMRQPLPGFSTFIPNAGIEESPSLISFTFVDSTIGTGSDCWRTVEPGHGSVIDPDNSYFCDNTVMQYKWTGNSLDLKESLGCGNSTLKVVTGSTDLPSLICYEIDDGTQCETVTQTNLAAEL
ncbi:hypothetical protein OEA41_009288 [Lepraria neglecta]|uniref:Ubiquitin 3 binding protein But2 C-terminal domain-containing protein n=1 Tax=Lepraria neglecta TaxID=209136 RepID=A0AAD9Z1C8_9LECA|nr:hypothetical protein OEA41_009288 [Lepraria neglecta]